MDEREIPQELKSDVEKLGRYDYGVLNSFTDL
jgi:hypothetical protein